MLVRTNLDIVRKIKKFFLYAWIAIIVLVVWKGQRQIISAKEGDAAEVLLSPMKNEIQRNGITYYDFGVYGKLLLEKACYDSETLKIIAIPEDSVAESSVSQSENEGNQGEYLIPGWKAEENESGYEINFCFQEEGKWRFQILCESESEYYSEEFIIDTTEPVLAIKYGNISEIHGECRNIANLNKVIEKNLKAVTSSECEIYTQKNGLITLEITENNFMPDDIKIQLYQIDYEKNSWENVTDSTLSEKINWEQRDNKYTFTVRLDEEGHYRIQLEYQDPAGWKVTGQGREEKNCMKEKCYEGPIYTVDQTAPIIEQILYQKEPKRKEKERAYFVQEPVMTIWITEENFNQADFSLQDKMMNANGNVITPALTEEDYTLQWTSQYVDGKRVNEAVVTVKEQANHIFSIQAVDGSGWTSGAVQKEVTYDKEPPTINYRADRLQEGDILLNPENIWFFPYNSYRYFSREKIRITVTARDVVSGISEIRCYFTDEQGQRVQNSVEKAKNSKKDVKTEELEEFRGEFVLDWENFKGNFYVTAEDYAGIQSQEIQGKGIVSESEQFHRNVSMLEITVPEAAYTDEKRKIKYFNQPFSVRVFGEDHHSGVKELKISAREEKEKASEQRKSIFVRKDYSEKEDVTYVGEKVMTINETQFSESCGENPIKIEATLKDNAGHVSKKIYEDYKIVIDCEKPEISVDYDDYYASNEKYYNRTRTALVTVKDWNFDSSRVRWQISGSNQKYSIGKWTGDGELHQCKVLFDQDGEDYKIKLTVTDYAGNQTQWNEDQPFTIDKTSPLMELHMNRADVQNGKYYSSPKDVFLTVKDRNIAEEDVKIHVDAKRDGKKLSSARNVERTGKITEGSRYDAKLYFHNDGDYQVSVQCKDLAGNISEIVRIPEFVLDRTSPRLQLTGIKRGMAYGGDFSPRISCMDRNLNEETFQAEIQRMDGFEGKIPAYTKTSIKEKEEKGVQIQWEDFPHRRWADGIYVLKIFGEDYAGNRIQMEKGIPFYVNRYGSLYSLEKSTGEIIKKGYLQQEEDIMLREVSVNDTIAQISVWKDNQERRDLSEGEEGKQAADYLVQNVDTSKYTNGKRGWHEKEYRIYKDNFTEEGSYQITIYSTGYIFQNGKNTKIKETTNELQNQSVRFTVDKTPPVVQISGLEEKTYKEKRHTMIITSMDNYALEHVEVKIHYEGGRKKDDIYQFASDAFGDNHSLELELKGYAGRQIVSYKAWDRAGNCTDSSRLGKNISCMISDQKKAQVDEAKILFPGAVILMLPAGAVAVALWLLLKGKIRIVKKEKRGNL